MNGRCRPSVLVTQRVVIDEHGGPRDALSHDWTEFLAALGAEPVPVPNRLDNAARFAERIGPRAVVVSGGDDVPEWGRASPRKPGGDGPPEAWRDWTESRLIAWALERRVPVLGVCRGMQLINRLFGGRITRDVTAAGYGEHVGATHEVCFVAEDWARLSGAARLRVNSFHRHGVRTEDLAGGLACAARSPDGLIEAVHAPGHRLVGVQWHPEREPRLEPANLRIVSAALGLDSPSMLRAPGAMSDTEFRTVEAAA